MTENKLLPLPVVLWLCGWEGCEAQYEDSKDGFFARLGDTDFFYGVQWKCEQNENGIHIDSLDGISCYSDRECFWATVRSMEQQAWAKLPWSEELLIKSMQLCDHQGKQYQITLHKAGTSMYVEMATGQTPWECLTTMVSEIYHSGICGNTTD